MIGARIAFLRRRAGLSQSALAGAVGVTPAALGAYEQGRRMPAAAVLVALANRLEVSTDYLLTGEPGRAGEVGIASDFLLYLRAMTPGRDQGRDALITRIFLELTKHRQPSG